MPVQDRGDMSRGKALAHAVRMKGARTSWRSCDGVGGRDMVSEILRRDSER